MIPATPETPLESLIPIFLSVITGGGVGICLFIDDKTAALVSIILGLLGAAVCYLILWLMDKYLDEVLDELFRE